MGRPVCALEDKYPGRVEETRNLRGKELTREERRIFVVKYYLNTVGEGKAKRVIEYKRAQLLPLLTVREATQID